jgi:hypothetical protein
MDKTKRWQIWLEPPASRPAFAWRLLATSNISYLLVVLGYVFWRWRTSGFGPNPGAGLLGLVIAYPIVFIGDLHMLFGSQRFVSHDTIPSDPFPQFAVAISLIVLVLGLLKFHKFYLRLLAYLAVLALTIGGLLNICAWGGPGW